MGVEPVVVEESAETIIESATELIQRSPRDTYTVPVEEMPPVVVFIHNQRSSGTSFRKAMTRNVPPASLREWAPKTESEIPKDLLNPDVRFATQGHLEFGAYPYIGRRFAYITFLRRPAERLVSWYQYRQQGNRERPDDPPYPDDETSFEEWVFSGRQREADNGQVRRLSGFNPPYGEVSAEHLELAKANLRRHFVIVGLAERYLESMALVGAILGWRLVNSVARPRTHREDVPEDLMERVRVLNQYDEQLYDYAEAGLNRAIERFGPAFRPLYDRLAERGRTPSGMSLLEYELERLDRGRL